MTLAEQSSAMGCPGCVAAPAPSQDTRLCDATLALSLPTIHCQACIATVEQALEKYPGVLHARVNLTRKQAMIDAAGDVTAAELAAVVRAAGFDAWELDPDALQETRTGNLGRDLLMRMAVAGFAAMNVMLLSVAVWSGATDATRGLFHWISAAITLPALAFSAQPFFRNAWSALRARRLNMDVPISLAIALAVATSLWETSLSGKHAYFDAALTLTFFLLAGRWLEARARSAARSAAEELTALEVPRAWKVIADEPTEVPVSELRAGDAVLVRPGSRAPVDGVVIRGTSEVDRSALTGETLPEMRRTGDAVSAGEVNLTGPLVLKATAVGTDTSLHRLAALVAVAESGRSRYTSLADKAATLYAPGVHILAALSFFGWLLWAGDMRVAANIAAAVLIITCPCALGLAVPAVTTAASGRLFGRGLLIKNATALERLAQVDTVVFDKTGTLTEGNPQLTNWHDLTADQQAMAAMLAQGSAHPLSQAVASAAREAGLEVPLADVREVPGYGTELVQGGEVMRLGRPDWLGADARGDQLAAAFQAGSQKPVVLTFSDSLRPGAEALVQQLVTMGKEVILLSGDRAAAVRSIAGRLGISRWEAAVLPDQKADFVQKLQEDGRNVLMVGDGLNDTAALASAHVSISPAQALDAARAASDIVLLGRDLTPVGEALATAMCATKRIRENFRIATVYNIVAVPLAVAGLATPLIAALAMSLSSLTVSANALRISGKSR
ncbi:heavy metal translocating P-type ATPase [uncultured Roseobacter sp.]|uniref:heavy metal translocating P-type ATPase n=1 Tax=uncultured Roseobacter sp. TaxID=114847 RepID=UPI0026200683|nr:heavy metal translocating P-type ATPase [uncultured Roseobacter sp.]